MDRLRHPKSVCFFAGSVQSWASCATFGDHERERGEKAP